MSDSCLPGVQLKIVRSALLNCKVSRFHINKICAFNFLALFTFIKYATKLAGIFEGIIVSVQDVANPALPLQWEAMKMCEVLRITNFILGFSPERTESSEKCLRRVEKIRHVLSNRSF